MIKIINVDENPRETGVHLYEIRINNKFIANFRHKREEGLSKCLKIASEAVNFEELFMKIETGCLAMVVKSYSEENLGKIGRVGKYIGDIDGCFDKENWEFSIPLRVAEGVTGNFKYENIASESQLIRIYDI